MSLRPSSVLTVLLVATPLCLAAQGPPPSGGGSRGLSAETLEGMRNGSLVVRVRLATGGMLGVPALVQISSISSGQQLQSGTQENSQVTFRGLGMGVYQIEVSAPGYRNAREEAELFIPGSTATAIVTILPDTPDSAGTSPPPGPPILAPKAREAVQKALVALELNDLKQAQKWLKRAGELASGHPQVNYLQGVLLMRTKEYVKALEFLRKATTADPKFQEPHAAIGVVLYSQNDFAGARTSLEFGLKDRTGPWAAHWALASLYFKSGNYAGARDQAEHAGAGSDWKKAEISMILIQALDALGEQARCMREMRLFLERFPISRFSDQVRQDLERMQRPKPMRAEVAEQQLLVAEDEGAIRLKAELPFRRWAPPDVDDKVPPVAPGQSCSLPDILAGAGRRAAALLESLERITATETIEHTELDRGGTELWRYARDYNYLASYRKRGDEHITVEELRNGVPRPEGLPSDASTSGLAAMAMVFHPYFQRDFEMKCEGLGSLDGQAMWQVYFRQKNEMLSRLRLMETPAGRFPLKLKGRAWITTNSFQVARLITDLAEPVPAVFLTLDQVRIDYRPVEFKQKGVRLWLPAVAEVYTHIHTRRLVQRHTFSEFQLFSVETDQKISAPKLPPAPPQP